ncbi:unnamed protein product, partial [marine sediment metagenome]
WAAFAGNPDVLPYLGKRCEPLEKLSEKNHHQEPIDHPKG